MYSFDLLTFWPHSALPNKMSPWERWTQSKPDLNNLFIWGCPCYVMIPHQRRVDPKLGDVSFEGVAVGLSKCRSAVRVLNRGTGRVVESIDIRFNVNAYVRRLMESTLGAALPPNNSNMIDIGPAEDWKPPVAAMPPQLPNMISFNNHPVNQTNAIPSQAPVVVKNEPIAVVPAAAAPPAGAVAIPAQSQIEPALIPLRRVSERIRAQPARFQSIQEDEHARRHGRVNVMMTVEEACYIASDIYGGNEHYRDPITFLEAVTHPVLGEHWRNAVEQELNNLIERGTWTFDNLPPGRRAPLGHKWVFKTKKDNVGMVSKYKARLSVKGCSQKYGIDYNETYAPTVHYITLRTVLALAAAKGPNVIMRSWDVVGAYLWADVDADIYMEFPQGLKNIPNGYNCLRLLKALYGLKQAGRLWHKLLSAALIGVDLHYSEHDECLYTWYSADGLFFLFLVMWVDDILCVTNSQAKLDAVHAHLTSLFELQDVGEPNMIVGINITRDPTTGAIKISQERYILDIVARYGMGDCAPVYTPAVYGLKLCADDGSGELELSVPYREAVGALMYAAVCTRPDVAFIVNRLARYVNKPMQTHWSVLKRVLAYFKGTYDRGITYHGNVELITYCDADFAEDVDDRTSNTGYVCLVAGGAVAWRSARQNAVSMSTYVAELFALCDGTKETLFMRDLLSDLHSCANEPTVVFGDNQAALHAVNQEGTLKGHAKPRGVRIAMMREAKENGETVFEYVVSEANAADCLTKALAAPAFERTTALVMNDS